MRHESFQKSSIFAFFLRPHQNVSILLRDGNFEALQNARRAVSRAQCTLVERDPLRGRVVEDSVLWVVVVYVVADCGEGL